MAAETPEEKKARLQAEAKARAEEQRRRREAAAVRAAEDAEKTRKMQDAYKSAGGQGMKSGGNIVTEKGPRARLAPRKSMAPQPEKSVADRLKATAFKAGNRTFGRVADLPFEAYQRLMDAGGMPDEQMREARKRFRQRNLEKEEGAYFKKGGKIKKYARGGGIESRGKTRGRFV